MRSRSISAITVVVCVLASAVEGFAIAADYVEEKKPPTPTSPDSPAEQYEPSPGPCIDGFAPENCVEPAGCTATRRNEIDERAADDRYADFLGTPIGGYVEVDDGCKREFQEGMMGSHP